MADTRVAAVQWTGDGPGRHPLVTDADGQVLEWAQGEVRVLEYGIAERVKAAQGFAGVALPPPSSEPEQAPETPPTLALVQPSDVAPDVAPADTTPSAATDSTPAPQPPVAVQTPPEASSAAPAVPAVPTEQTPPETGTSTEEVTN